MEENAKKQYEDLHLRSYHDLMELAEMCEEDTGDDKCHNAIHAMEELLRYGTCHDVAVGMKYFTEFINTHVALDMK